LQKVSTDPLYQWMTMRSVRALRAGRWVPRRITALQAEKAKV